VAAEKAETGVVEKAAAGPRSGEADPGPPPKADLRAGEADSGADPGDLDGWEYTLPGKAEREVVNGDLGVEEEDGPAKAFGRGGGGVKGDSCCCCCCWKMGTLGFCSGWKENLGTFMSSG